MTRDFPGLRRRPVSDPPRRAYGSGQLWFVYIYTGLVAALLAVSGAADRKEPWFWTYVIVAGPLWLAWASYGFAMAYGRRWWGR